MGITFLKKIVLFKKRNKTPYVLCTILKNIEDGMAKQDLQD